jgi:hypothetical protein
MNAELFLVRYESVLLILRRLTIAHFPRVAEEKNENSHWIACIRIEPGIPELKPVPEDL